MTLLSLCKDLRCQTIEAAVGDSRQSSPAARLDLCAAFQLALTAHSVLQESALFPAVLESMGGSDAVCLRNITDELSADHRALELLCARAASASATSLAAADALVALCERHQAFERDELWPMAERLLSDEDIARFKSAMTTLGPVPCRSASDQPVNPRRATAPWLLP